MKRSHIDDVQTDLSPALPVLLPELLRLIGAQLDEPWFLDLRAFLRWHQCCRAHWAVYCAREQTALHYLLTQKRERQMLPSNGVNSRHLEAALNCGRLSRAVTQSALLVAIEAELQSIPQRVTHESRQLKFRATLSLNELINFRDYRNPAAITILEWVAQYVLVHYGWHLQLALAYQNKLTVMERPWKARDRALPGIILVFSASSDDNNNDNEKQATASDNVKNAPRRNEFQCLFNDLLGLT